MKDLNRATLHRFILFVLFLGVLGGGAATIFGFLGKWYWRFDLFSHFREYYLIFFVLIVCASLCMRNRTIFLIATVFFILNFIPWLPFYLPSQKSVPNSQKSITIYTANVQMDNREYEKVVSQIKEVDPGIVVLVEVDDTWLENIAELKTTYPFSVGAPQGDNFGVLLMSKYPLEDEQIVWLGSYGAPNAVATVVFEGQKITVIGSHPVPPFNKRLSRMRDEHIDEISTIIDTQTVPTVLVGDLNATPFSYPYRQLVTKQQLTHCAKGFGLQRTWQFTPLMPPIPLAIDHCLHTKGIVVLNSYVGEDIGSDHRPIINTIAILEK